MLSHSTYFGESIKNNVSNQYKYKEAMLRVLLPIQKVQIQINIFWTFLKYFTLMSDSKYKLFRKIMHPINMLFGSDPLKYNIKQPIGRQLQLMPSFNTITKYFSSVTVYQCISTSMCQCVSVSDCLTV